MSFVSNSFYCSVYVCHQPFVGSVVFFLTCLRQVISTHPVAKREFNGDLVANKQTIWGI